MLVTRPEPDATDTAARLAALDIEAALFPLLSHETLQTSIPDPAGFAAVALTSGNALRALEQRGALKDFCGLPAFTVGDRTARLARDMGFTEVTSAGGTLSDLVDLLAHAGVKGPIFYPTGRDQSGDLAKSLAPFGVMTIATQVYAMNAATDLPEQIVGELDDGSIDAALFYSRRTAETFAKLAGEKLGRLSRLELGMLCLSETVAQPLVDAHFVRVGLADYPSEEAMMALALSFARDHNAS
jgi:uroporphyrinogen-III synthase